jgi:hypothetical protein
LKKAPRWLSLLLLAIFAFPVAVSGLGGTLSFAPAVLAGSETDGQMPPEEETQDHEVFLVDSLLPGDHDLSVAVPHASLAISEPDLVAPPPPPDGLLS